MRVIFLDVDGVLNTTYTKNRIPGLNFIGVDPRRVEKLRSLVDQSNQLDETVIVITRLSAKDTNAVMKPVFFRDLLF